jgi:thiol:disulfide interchange protein
MKGNRVMKWVKPCLSLLTAIILAGCSQKTAPSAGDEIHWIADIDSALVLAAKTDTILMIDFMATWCPPCRAMEDSTFNQPAVIEKTRHFLTVRIDVDQQGNVANEYNGNAAKYGGVGIPNILFLDKNRNRLAHLIGFQPAERLTAVMDSVLTEPER